jgi:hypothetical protein
MAGLDAAIQKTQRISSHNWMAGSGPAMTGERKFGDEHPGNQESFTKETAAIIPLGCMKSKDRVPRFRVIWQKQTLGS